MSEGLLYQGSVKNLYRAEKGSLEFEFTDAYSVFDWGRMPDEIPGKGAALSSLAEYFLSTVQKKETWKSFAKSQRCAQLLSFYGARFRTELEQELMGLTEKGLATHFVERRGERRVAVREVAILRPEKTVFNGQKLYDYSKPPELPDSRLLPLEVVFRMGMPAGSSLAERLTPEYARVLGLGDAVPVAGSKFAGPVLEFFTKLEETDRFLSVEQAFHYARVGREAFTSLVARTLLLASWLEEVFGAKGLELWDGKVEWALLDGKLTLVDSIGPDELRLLVPGTDIQVSKEFLRQFYRNTPWYAAVQAAKKNTPAGKDWKSAVVSAQGEPPRLSAEYLRATQALYATLAQALTGEHFEAAAADVPSLGRDLKAVSGGRHG